jgi:hypothetical protein
MTRVRRKSELRSVGSGFESSNAQQLAARADQQKQSYPLRRRMLPVLHFDPIL